MAENNEKKKGRGGAAAGGVIGIAAIAALLFGGNRFGLFDGFLGTNNNSGTDSGSSQVQETVAETSAPETSAPEQTSAESSAETAAETEAAKEITVKVSGGKYLLDGEEVTLEELPGRIPEGASVRITDDGATQNAMEALQKSLTDGGITYLMENAPQ